MLSHHQPLEGSVKESGCEWSVRLDEDDEFTIVGDASLSISCKSEMVRQDDEDGLYDEIIQAYEK